MDRLEEIKQKYAKTVECDNWAKFVLAADKGEILMALNVISQEFKNAALQEAAEKIEIKIENMEALSQNRITISEIDALKYAEEILESLQSKYTNRK